MKTFYSKTEALQNKPKLRTAVYAVGARLRYKGIHRSWIRSDDGRDIPLVFPGMEVTIARVHPPRPDLLQLWECEETGEWLWSREDGYSVYLADPKVKGAARIIWPEDANEWEPITLA